MKEIKIQTSHKVFGIQVRTFPERIKESFEALMNQIPNGSERSYYGISWMENGSVVYYAAAEQKHEGEGKQYNAREFVLEAGNYLYEEVDNWMSKLDSFKNIFDRMMSDPRIDKSAPAIEWYKSNEVMWCMIRLAGK